MTRLSNEQEAIREKARELANAVIAPRAAAVDREEAYPWDNVRALREAGFVGMTIPRDLGGPGLGFLEVALVIEEMAGSAASPGASRWRPTWARSAPSWPTAARRRSAWRRSRCSPATSRPSASPSPAPAAPPPR